jgi:hypothetical protein
VKVVRKPSVIPFGPVGHPRARLFPEFERKSSSAAAEALKLAASCQVGNGVSLLAIYNPHLSLSDNGFHLLDVLNDEVDDGAIAALPVCPAYTPAAPGAPGRKLEQFQDWLPKCYRNRQVEVLTKSSATENSTACDHDVGLESASAVLVSNASGRLFQEDEYLKLTFKEEGRLYLTTTCSRCGQLHGVAASPA